MSAESAPAAAPNVVEGTAARSPEPEAIVAAQAATEVEAAAALSESPPASNPRPVVAVAEAPPAIIEREQAAARIRTSALLPPAIRDCLARVVETSGEAAGGQTRVPVEELVRAVEEAVPDFLRVDRRRAAAPAHPAGDAFFSGDPAGLSDREAEEIARGQLARSGLLRGQRVRVAD